jgi:hypothetical protein
MKIHRMHGMYTFSRRTNAHGKEKVKVGASTNCDMYPKDWYSYLHIAVENPLLKGYVDTF